MSRASTDRLPEPILPAEASLRLNAAQVTFLLMEALQARGHTVSGGEPIVSMEAVCVGDPWSKPRFDGYDLKLAVKLGVKP